MKRAIVAAVIAAASIPATTAQRTYTYVDLVKQLTDLETLAELPAPGETCSQCSSYDRASRFDTTTGKYVNWDANGDGGGIIRQENDTVVMAEMTGPGCIWRIWSAKADAGHVRIYLDGAAEPAVDLPFSGYFDGKNAPFVYPSLVHMTALGVNCYVPIPYQKSCRIVADQGWGNYYHFVYETFPRGTVVPTFRRALAPAETAALAAADQTLNDGRGKDPAGFRAGELTLSRQVQVPAGQKLAVGEIFGPRAITAIRVKMDFASREDEVAALRELALAITWDGQPAPAVWAPLGDFFGSAPGVNRYRSLPLGMTDDGFYCFWYMPFAKSAHVELMNDGAADRALAVEITHAPLARPIETLGRFHAKWHRDAFLPAEPERAIDWTMLKTQGRGRFCGVMLHVWNPRGGWWGEGDEKFFVDGEKFPSTIGTGSEDYFGYAWCNPTLFQNAYHNQTISMGNKGNISVNRWHVTDNIPFQRSFEGAIEKYYPNSRPTLYACTAYWYLAPGGTDSYSSVLVEERTAYFQIEPPTFRIRGALEGEALEVLARTGGTLQEQAMDGYGEAWSGASHLWWTDAKPGDRLELALPVKEAGAYRLSAQLTKAIDYGIVQLSLDDKKLGGTIDLYNDGVVATGPIALGTHELAAGKHRFVVEITGANAKAVKSYMFGLDYLKLEPVAAGAGAPIRVLVVTGGHGYEEGPFDEMWRALPGIAWRHVAHPAAAEWFDAEHARDYDVIALYDLIEDKDVPLAARSALAERVREEAKGLIVWHHALGSYQNWPAYTEMAGGRYNMTAPPPDQYGGKPSTYKHDVTLTVQPQPGHPIVDGIAPFELVDEVYGDFYVAPDVTVLLRTEHPQSGPLLGWAKSYGKGRVVGMQLGHGPTAWNHPAFRELFARSIRWAAARK